MARIYFLVKYLNRTMRGLAVYYSIFILKRRHQEDGLFEEFPVNHQGAIHPNHKFRSVSSSYYISSKKE